MPVPPEEVQRRDLQRRLSRAVQEAGEHAQHNLAVRGRGARWLRDAVNRVAREPGDGINPDLRTSRAVPEAAQQLEVLIRGIHRLVNRRVLAIVQASGSTEKPRRDLFPHLSQRDKWSATLLSVGLRLVPEVTHTLLLAIETENKK